MLIAPTDVSRLTLIGPAWVAWLTLANPGIGSGGEGRCKPGSCGFFLAAGEVGAATCRHTGLKMGEGQAPRNRMGSDTRRENAGSKNAGDHVARVTRETAVAPALLYMRDLVVLLERGFGGLVLRLPLVACLCFY